jgi:hypothetical protein
MGVALDTAHLDRLGWVRVPRAVPEQLCACLVDVLERELGVPVHDPSRWHEHGGQMCDLIPIWGHQAQWDIRQHPGLHRIWAALWGTEALAVSLDSCRFTPPWQSGYAEPYGIHWDHDPHDDGKRMFQGVLALTDTAAGQGGFRCVPSLFHDRTAWPKAPAGPDDWLADTAGREIVHVPASAGDLIVWDSRLPHGNSRNLGAAPRLAFYIQMFPADRAQSDVAIASWRSGRCVPWWRDRPGYDRTEPWRPATLSPLGRRLLGLDSWD